MTETERPTTKNDGLDSERRKEKWRFVLFDRGPISLLCLYGGIRLISTGIGIVLSSAQGSVKDSIIGALVAVLGGWLVCVSAFCFYQEPFIRVQSALMRRRRLAFLLTIGPIIFIGAVGPTASRWWAEKQLEHIADSAKRLVVEIDGKINELYEKIEKNRRATHPRGSDSELLTHKLLQMKIRELEDASAACSKPDVSQRDVDVALVALGLKSKEELPPIKKEKKEGGGGKYVPCKWCNGGRDDSGNDCSHCDHGLVWKPSRR